MVSYIGLGIREAFKQGLRFIFILRTRVGDAAGRWVRHSCVGEWPGEIEGFVEDEG